MKRDTTQGRFSSLSSRQFSRQFQAMGTEVTVWLWNNSEQRANQVIDGTMRFFVQMEQKLSRFLPDRSCRNSTEPQDGRLPPRASSSTSSAWRWIGAGERPGSLIRVY